MPIRWYGPANPEDPTYRHFSRVVNLIIHIMAFAAVNSGLWFFELIRHKWSHLDSFSEVWLIALLLHLGIVIALRPGKIITEAVESE